MALLAKELSTSQPVDISAELSLSDSTTYTLQAQGGDLYFIESSAVPTGEDFIILEERRQAQITHTSAEKLYAWGYGKLVLFT